MITCRDLTRRFGAFTAVDRLTLEVATGSICAVLGPNGAGKSTTVKMLTGLLEPSSGEATVCGLNATTDSLAIKRKIGVLPENLGLRSEEHTSELQSRQYLVCRLLLEKKKKKIQNLIYYRYL